MELISTVLKIVLIATVGVTICQAEMMPGGLTEEKQPSASNNTPQKAIQQLSDIIKSQASQQLSTSSGNGATTGDSLKNEVITVLSYKTQVVAGTNYFVKTRIGKYVFLLRIYENLQRELSLEGLKGPVSETDEIIYF
ncbi:unnamed protein product [Orchesella dallaii]|uniref:Cystatin domain-containing protein n=1 Tax=Orchesella dallaii TaxID=48710 RepID=A0ABP1R2P1_9HEXA